MSAAEQLEIANGNACVVAFDPETRIAVSRDSVHPAYADEVFQHVLERLRRDKAFNRLPAGIVVQLRDHKGNWRREEAV